MALTQPSAKGAIGQRSLACGKLLPSLVVVVSSVQTQTAGNLFEGGANGSPLGIRSAAHIKTPLSCCFLLFFCHFEVSFYSNASKKPVPMKWRLFFPKHKKTFPTHSRRHRGESRGIAVYRGDIAGYRGDIAGTSRDIAGYRGDIAQTSRGVAGHPKTKQKFRISKSCNPCSKNHKKI